MADEATFPTEEATSAPYGQMFFLKRWMLSPPLVPICVVLSLALLCLWAEQVEDIVAFVVNAPTKGENELCV